MSAKFLVRFDDMCPTVNWPLWQQLEQVMIDEDVRPILAVVPDNLDPRCTKASATSDSGTWCAVGRRAVGHRLHGYQHRYVNRNAGMVGLNHYSEFAGVPIDEQRDKLIRDWKFSSAKVRSGMLDRARTLVRRSHGKAVSELGVNHDQRRLVAFPASRRRIKNVVWVPQQLWKFRYVPFGVWTDVHSFR